MMKLKSILFIVCLLQGAMTLNATIVQKLVLKNGSELEGYISKQRPGSNFTFVAEKAVIYMPGTEAKNIFDNEIKIKDLSPAWIKWAEKNDAFQGIGDDRVLTLSNIVTEKKTINRVRILEKGAKIKYLEMNDNLYSLDWDTIEVVKVSKRIKTALTGINRVYKLKNGTEYEGQYVEEVPGKTLSLYSNSGVVEVFNTDEVIKYSMKKINPNQSLFEQSELLDIVQLKDNTVKTGIIIEQNFNEQNPSNNYLLIQTVGETTESVKLADIIEYRKEVNPQYTPLYDVLLKKGELVINRQPIYKMKIEESDGYIILPQDTGAVVITKTSPSTEVIIETHFQNDNTNQTLEIVRVKDIKDRKKRHLFWGFTYEDIVKTQVRPKSVQTSVNKTTKLIYSFDEIGLYVIYNPIEKNAIPFIIK